MKRIIGAILGMVLAASTLAVVTPAPPALAVAGCHGRFVLKGSVWGVTITHNDNEFRYGWVEQYFMCPNGSKPAKMKAIKSAVCVTKLSRGQDIYLAGFKFKLRIGDHTGYNRFYKSFKLDWDNGAGDVGDVKCITHNHTNTPWIPGADRPYWKPKGWIRYHIFPDSEFYWDHSKHAIREFDLLGDPILDPLHPPSAEELFGQWSDNQQTLPDTIGR